MKATDADNERLVYTLENARTSPFTIVRSNGQLQVGQPLDHETQETYTVVVRVTDSEDENGNFEIPPTVDDTITVIITVNDVEEPGKVRLSWTRPHGYGENLGTETVASLTDPDGNVSNVTWKWQILGNEWSDISRATSNTYRPAGDDVNKRLRAVASYTDPRGGGKTATSETAYVKPVPDPNPAPEFQVNTSGGYACSNGEAQMCLYVSNGSILPAPKSTTQPRRTFRRTPTRETTSKYATL